MSEVGRNITRAQRELAKLDRLYNVPGDPLVTATQIGVRRAIEIVDDYLGSYAEVED